MMTLSAHIANVLDEARHGRSDDEDIARVPEAVQGDLRAAVDRIVRLSESGAQLEAHREYQAARLDLADRALAAGIDPFGKVRPGPSIRDQFDDDGRSEMQRIVDAVPRQGF